MTLGHISAPPKRAFVCVALGFFFLLSSAESQISSPELMSVASFQVVIFHASHRQGRPAIIELFLKNLRPLYTRSQGPKKLEANVEHFGVANWPPSSLLINART